MRGILPRANTRPLRAKPVSNGLSGHTQGCEGGALQACPAAPDFPLGSLPVLLSRPALAASSFPVCVGETGDFFPVFDGLRGLWLSGLEF